MSGQDLGNIVVSDVGDGELGQKLLHMSSLLMGPLLCYETELNEDDMRGYVQVQSVQSIFTLCTLAPLP